MFNSMTQFNYLQQSAEDDQVTFGNLQKSKPPAERIDLSPTLA